MVCAEPRALLWPGMGYQGGQLCRISRDSIELGASIRMDSQSWLDKLVQDICLYLTKGVESALARW